MLDQKNLVLRWSLFAVILVGAISFMFLYDPVPNVKLSNVEYVRERNSSFKAGREKLLAGDFAQAEKLFTAALVGTQNLNQEAYIKFYIATAVALKGEYIRAVELLKMIADNENYSDSHRAYALELMGEVYYKSGKDPKVTGLIFSTPPYVKLLVEGSPEASYQKLYDYLLTFYPTGLASYRRAVAMLYDNSTSSVQELRDGIQALGSEISLFKDFGMRKEDLGLRYMMRANLLAALSAKEGDSDARRAEVEADFKEAIALSDTSSNLRIRAGYYYALFLAQEYGTARTEDITRLLSPFNEPNSLVLPFYKSFLDTERQADPHIVRSVQTIAAIDPVFRQSMVSLGWKL